MRVARRIAAQFLVALALTFLAGELALRWLDLAPARFSDTRFGFITPRSWRNLADDLAGYYPDAEVRDAAFYVTRPISAAEFAKKPIGPDDFALEYDFRFHTNNLGLVQRRDLACGTSATAVIGDSFGEGLGSSPWFYRLEEERNPGATPLANLSMLGFSIQSFARSLDYHSPCLAFQKVVLLVIGDDFYRPLWRFRPDELDCIDRDLSCGDDKSLFARMTLDASVDDLRAAALTRARDRYTYLSAPSPWRSQVVQLAELIVEGFERRGQVQRSVDALRSIAARVGVENLRLIQLPMKDEAQANALRSTSQQAFDDVKRAGFVLDPCPLAADDFLPRDVHPTIVGYAKLRACVAGALAGLDAD